MGQAHAELKALRAMPPLLPVLSFAARHLLAVCLATFLACFAWTISYAILLLLAILGNDGVGSPVAYPGGLLLIVGICLFWGLGVFAPASAIGACLCRWLALPRLAAIPIVFAAAFLLVLLHQALFWSVFKALLIQQDRPGLGASFANFLLYASLPLGIYWWTTEGPGAVFELLMRRLRRRREQRPSLRTEPLDSPKIGEGGDGPTSVGQKSPSS
jgi:hypothetical protein